MRLDLALDQLAEKLTRALMKTEDYRVSARQRKMIETGFGDLKGNLGLTRLRLRGLTGARDEFLARVTHPAMHRPSNSQSTFSGLRNPRPSVMNYGAAVLIQLQPSSMSGD